MRHINELIDIYIQKKGALDSTDKIIECLKWLINVFEEDKKEEKRIIGMYEYEEYVKAKHAGQTRWNRKPYFDEHCVKVSQHVIKVAKALGLNLDLTDCHTVKTLWAIGLGHDLLEDTNATFDEIQKFAGEEVANAIFILTKKNGVYKESYFDYIMRVKNSENIFAQLVKLADLECNISDLIEGSMKEKYKLAHYIIKESL